MADINIDFFNPAELVDAAYNGDVTKLQSLMADPAYIAVINNPMNSQGHAALFFACRGAANPEAVRILLNAGADPFQRDNSGHLPLHFATNSLNLELILVLLAVPNMSNFKFDAANDGQTPFHALFLPDASGNPKNTNAISECLPLFLERDKNPLGYLHQQDKNGLSSLMLVKHYNLKAGFDKHVPSKKVFATFLNSIVVPGNIEELLKSNIFRYVSFNEIATANADNTVSMRPTP